MLILKEADAILFFIIAMPENEVLTLRGEHDLLFFCCFIASILPNDFALYSGKSPTLLASSLSESKEPDEQLMLSSFMFFFSSSFLSVSLS